jgi:uncharacterized protein with GYD domain
VATYVTFFRYSPEAWRRMIDTPENRAVAARKLIEKVGGTMQVFYWMFGEWDGLVIYDVPESSMAAAFSGIVTSSGLLAQLETHQLVPMDEARNALQQAKTSRRPTSRRAISGSGWPSMTPWVERH